MYPRLDFPTRSDRPTFYSNFVETIDGKVAVNQPGYWPIGSTVDYQTLIELRAHADALIHGKTTALSHRTVDSLVKPEFQDLRSQLGKSQPLHYVVVSAHPDSELTPFLSNPKYPQVSLVTTEQAETPTTVETLRFGQEQVDLLTLVEYLHRQGYQKVLIEGGPHLFGSFVALGLMDEVFVTIAPKLFGGDPTTSLGMTVGPLLSPDTICNYQLRETHQVNDELFLHYSRPL